MTGTTASPSATASAPPGQKSFCTSMISSISSLPGWICILDPHLSIFRLLEWATRIYWMQHMESNCVMTTMDRSSDPRLNWAALSQAGRDAAYDNNAAVKNSAALIAERNQLSEALRASRKSFLDLPYGDRDRTKIDLYPAADKATPCLVFLHGGYWQRNSRDVFAMLVEGVAAHGWSVAIPGYTLAPEATLTQIVTEISTALDWLATSNGEAHGIAGP